MVLKFPSITGNFFIVKQLCYFQRLAKRQRNHEKAFHHQEIVRQRVLAEMRANREQEIQN